uniref:Transposase n=1 Tax=Heterorhabditis bacteriophora TaxID=37862 RepID=A0A1I7XBZ7_HETBA
MTTDHYERTWESKKRRVRLELRTGHLGLPKAQTNKTYLGVETSGTAYRKEHEKMNWCKENSLLTIPVCLYAPNESNGHSDAGR